MEQYRCGNPKVAFHALINCRRLAILPDCIDTNGGVRTSGNHPSTIGSIRQDGCSGGVWK